MYNNRDKEILSENFENNYPPVAYIQNVYKAVCNYYRIPIGAGNDLSFNFDAAKICDTYKFGLLHFVNAMKTLEREGLISIPDNNEMVSKIWIMCNKQDLYNFQVLHTEYDNFIKMLLRMYGGLFTDFVPINETYIAKMLHYRTSDIETMLEKLEKLQILSYKKKTDKPQIIFTSERVDASYLYLSNSNYNHLKKTANNRINAMISYIEDTQHCRSNILLEYFGEKVNGTICSKCDVCILSQKNTKKKNNNIDQRLLTLLATSIMTIQQIVEAIPDVAEEEVIEAIRTMIEFGKLEMNYDMQISITKRR